MRAAFFAVSLFAIAACSSGDEGNDSSVTSPADMPGSSSGGAPPGEVSAFDPTVDSESEPGEDGRRWFYKSASRSALYGPPNSEGMLSLRCDAPGEGAKHVLFSWFARGAEVGEERVLELRSGGDTIRAEVVGVETELGPSAMWQARLAPGGEEAAFLLAAEDPISMRLDDGEEYAIRVPTSEQLRQVIRDCR